jgi:mannose-6-phosphate isomerase-like protein (cupin superfamily)
MTTPYTHVNLVADVEDAAPSFGLDHAQETRFAHSALEAERTGVTLQRIRPGTRPGFAHRHERAEEVYVVLAGSGRVKLDDAIVELAPRDAIRVAPSVIRSFEAGPDGLELLAVGAHHPDDGEAFFGWW